MDTITHGIVGALAGKALFAGKDKPAGWGRGSASAALSSPTSRAAIVACLIGSTFPDIDVFAGPLARNPLAIMEWHRNLTHSLILLPIWALLLAAVSIPLAKQLRWEAPPFAKLAGIYAFGILSHIILDAATNFGTMIWSPLHFTRVAWDWLFIVDFTFTAIALAPQMAAWCYRDPEKFVWRAGIVWVVLSAGVCGVYEFAAMEGFGFARWVAAIAIVKLAILFFAPRLGGIGFRWRRAYWSRAALAVLCAYVACAGAAHQKALAETAKFAASQNLQVQSLAALPLPPTPTHWTGVVTTPQGIWRTTFHIPGGKPESTELYAAADTNRFVAEARTLPDVRVYLWFARFPVWQVRRVQGKTVAEVTDVRFFRQNFQNWNDDPHAAGSDAQSRVNSPGFTFQIVFDPAGNVISHGFKKPE